MNKIWSKIDVAIELYERHGTFELDRLARVIYEHALSHDLNRHDHFATRVGLNQMFGIGSTNTLSLDTMDYINGPLSDAIAKKIIERIDKKGNYNE